MENINLTFPINELAAAIAEKLTPLFAGINTPAIAADETNHTRKETAAKLKISLPTLNEYTKRGLIQGHRFGVRVMYKQKDIDAALTKMNYGRAGNV